MRKIKLPKIAGNLVAELRKLHMNGAVVKTFLAVLK